MKTQRAPTLSKSLSPVHVVALSLGSIIGWMAFVMPGTDFLPKAGPLGVSLAFGVASLAMILIALNYGYMVNHHPVAGGEFAFASFAFGKYHAFFCAWFLILSYLMPVMLNAVALSHVLRTLFPTIIEIGPHYSVAGYDVTIVQLTISWLSLMVFASLCIRGVDSTGFFQTVLVLALVGSVGVMTGALATHSAAWESMRPALPSHGDVLVGFLHVLAVAPCAFVGFDTVPQGVEEFAFPYRRTKWIMIASIIAGMLIYIALALLASSSAPAEYGSWEAYAEALPNETGLRALPAFHAAYELLGGTGFAFLTYAAVAAVLSGILGFFMAASRLLFSIARAGVLPPWFARIHQTTQTPRNAILFIMCVSLVATLFGRTALGWLVDLCSLGAAIAYGYTSAATFMYAKGEGDRRHMATGAVGTILAILFIVLILVPIPAIGCSMSHEGYICFIAWSGLGLLFLLAARPREEKKGINQELQ